MQKVKHQTRRIASKPLYHRGRIDDQLVEDIFDLMETALSRLSPEDDWIVAIYLLYAEEDAKAFNQWDTRDKLKRSIETLFLEEAEQNSGLEHPACAPGKFALQEWGYSLELHNTASHFCCRLAGQPAQDHPKKIYYADVDLYLAEANGLAARGRFAAFTRTMPIIRNDERLVCGLNFEGNGSIAPHIDLSQRLARGRQNCIYLTERFDRILVGPYPACDFFAPMCKQAHWLNVVQDRNETRLDLPEWLDSNAGFEIDLIKDFDAQFNRRATFGNVIERRADSRDYYLRATARVLPKKAGESLDGYGADWGNLNFALSDAVSVSVRLNDEYYLGADAQGRAFIWHNRYKEPDVLSTDGQSVRIGEQVYEWEPDPTGTFYGFLRFNNSDSKNVSENKRVSLIRSDQRLTAIIARGASALNGMICLLPSYDEDELVSHRGSIIIKTPGNGEFELETTEVAVQRNLFILGEDGQWKCHKPANGAVKHARIKVPGEFVFGSTCYEIVPDSKSYNIRKHWSGKYKVLAELPAP